jgi:hypothetical protein
MAAPPPTIEELECVIYLKTQITQADLSDDDTLFLSDATFQRFARARDASKHKALELMKECCAWRKSYNPHHITADKIADILQLGTVYVTGTCLAGRPILYLTPGLNNPFPAEKRVSLMVYLLEETWRRGYPRLTWVLDMGHMGERGADDQSSETRKATMHILQNYYPERLGALYVVHAPWYFRALVTLVWPFLDSRTREKIHVSMKPEDLPSVIAPDQLISSLGGSREVSLEATAAEDLLPPAVQTLY